MDKLRAEQILSEAEALLNGHFLLTSGRHADKYMQCARVLQYPKFAEELCADIAKSFSGTQVDFCIGPAMGGIIVSYELARQLGAKNIFAERENGAMAIRRGFSIPKGAKVVIAEDVVTTGGSVVEVIELIRATGAEVVGVAALVDRSNGKVDFGVPFFAAYSADVVSYEANDCPICKEGKLPLVKPGSRQIP